MNTNLPLSDREIPISVTQEDIDIGRHNTEEENINIGQYCAVALAFNRAGYNNVNVDYFSVSANEEIYEPIDPVFFSNWISDFDSGKVNMEPTTFKFRKKH